VLRIRGSFNRLICLVSQRVSQAALYRTKAFDRTVVHPHKSPLTEWMTITFGDNHSGRCGANVSEKTGRSDMLSQIQQVAIAPGWSYAGKNTCLVGNRW